MAFTEAQLLEEKMKHHGWLQQQPGMTGTGVGLTAEGELRLKIYTDRMPETIKQQIRRRLGDAPVDFEEAGEFRAF